MATKLEIMREKLRAEKERTTKNENNTVSTGDNAAFPFWNLPLKTSATVRFLPDGNPENPNFWENRETIRLPFAGQVGGDYATDKEVIVTVPCIDMYHPGKSVCPIIAEMRPYWKQGPDEKAIARKYYKIRTYLFQGFVVSSELQEEKVPENPIRRFIFKPQIFKIIENSIMDSEMEDSPDDYVGGRDFKITRTKPGEYSDYTTSSWSFRTRSLNEAETLAIEQYGLFNLSSFIDPEPDSNGVELIKAMFKDSLAGNPFDFAAYGHAYRAYGKRQGGEQADTDVPVNNTTKPAVKHTQTLSEPVAQHVLHTPSEPTHKPATNGKPQAADILAALKAKMPGATR